MVLLEEAAYIPESVVKEVIVPIIGKSTTATVMISTPGKQPTNLFNRLSRSKAFRTVTITYVCPNCQQLGVKEICKHRFHERPHWMGGKDQVLTEIFGDDDEAIQRDMLGVMDEVDSPYCFPEPLVDKLFAKPMAEIYEPVRFVFVSIDPCAGTDNEQKGTSDFAIVSICGPHSTIVGIDAIPAITHHDWEGPLLKHLQSIRARPYFENCRFVVDVEGNGSMAWSHINAVVCQMSDVILLSDYKNKQATNTTNAAKKDMVDITRAVLEADDIRFMKGMITSHPHPDRVMQEFKRQMLSYERYVIANPSLRSQNSIIFSGKGSNKDKKDDICLTFQRALRWRRIFLESPKYRQYRI